MNTGSMTPQGTANPIKRLVRSASLRFGDLPISIKIGAMAVLGMITVAAAITLLMVVTSRGLFAGEARAELTGQNQTIASSIDELAAKAESDLLLARQNVVFNDYFLASDDATRQAALEGIHDQIQYFHERFAIDEICIIDNTGTEIARSVKGTLAGPDDLSDEEAAAPFFAPSLALADGETYRSPAPYLSPDTNQWVVAHTTPFVLPDGTKAGFFHFEIPLSWFAAEVNAGLMEGSHSFLMTKDGQLLAHPQIAEFRTAAGIDPSNPDQADFPPATASGSDDFHRLIESAKSGQAGTGTYSDGGEPTRWSTNLYSTGTGSWPLPSPTLSFTRQ